MYRHSMLLFKNTIQPSLEEVNPPERSQTQTQQSFWIVPITSASAQQLHQHHTHLAVIREPQQLLPDAQPNAMKITA